MKLVFRLFLFMFVNGATAFAGSIYVTSYSSPYVVGFGTDGTPLGQIASTGISPGNTNLAVDSAGQLYVSINADWTIQKFSKTGASLGVFLSRTNGIQAPWGLAIGPTGVSMW